MADVYYTNSKNENLCFKHAVERVINRQETITPHVSDTGKGMRPYDSWYGLEGLCTVCMGESDDDTT